MASLPIVFTTPFAEAYRKLPTRDLEAVDGMLDRLEHEHGSPGMRNQIRISEHVLFATPRIFGTEVLYRVTWTYDDRDSPTAVHCNSVAALET